MEAAKIILSNAVEKGELEYVKELLETLDLADSKKHKKCAFTTETVEHYKFSLISSAIVNKHSELVEMLLKSCFKIDDEDLKSIASLALHVATKSEDLDVVKLLLSFGAQVDVKDQNGFTALHKATGNEDIVEFLINNGANVNSNSLYGTPLHEAVRRRCARVVQVLLDHGALVDATCELHNSTPLHKAAECGQSKIADILLDHKANVYATQDDGTNAFTCAVKHCKVRVLKLLLKRGINVNVRDEAGLTALQYSLKNGDYNLMCFLLNQGARADMEDGKLSAIHQAAYYDKTSAMKKFMEYCEDVDVKDERQKTPLHYAAKEGSHKIVKLLLDHGACAKTLDGESRNALDCAVENSRQEGFQVLQLLLKPKYFGRASSRRHVISALNHAARCGNSKVVGFFLKHGISVKPEDVADFEMLAVHLAAAIGHENIVKKLLAAGADVNGKDSEGATPMHYAANCGQMNVVQFLLDNGADVKVMNGNLVTCLHFAVKGGNQELIKLFLKLGLEINAVDGDGKPPLHYAFGEKCSLSNALLLIDRGADFNIKVSDGKTIVDLLLEHPLEAQSFVKLLAKWKSAGVAISEGILMSVANNEELKAAFEKCEEEILLVMGKKLRENEGSLYDLFQAKSSKNLVDYARNADVVLFLESQDFRTNYTLYFEMIKEQFAKGQMKLKLINHDKVKYFFHRLFSKENNRKLPSLPLVVANEIFGYLSTDDLENLIRS